jgi:predicted transcriptional regulator
MKRMAQSVLEMAKDLVMAYVQAGALPLEDMQQVLQQTYASLAALKTQEETGSAMQGAEAAPEPVDWKRSMTRHTITCLECGAAFKQLSVRHLRDHDLDARSYRVKYGIPRTQPLAAKDTTAMRKRIVQQTRPWEKAPTYVKAHEAETKAREQAEREAAAKAKAAPPGAKKKARRAARKRTAQAGA